MSRTCSDTEILVMPFDIFTGQFPESELLTLEEAWRMKQEMGDPLDDLMYSDQDAAPMIEAEEP